MGGHENLFYMCHTLSFGEWLTPTATHTIFSKGSVEWLVNCLHLRICLLACDSGSCRTNYNGKVFNTFVGTLSALQHTVSNKTNSYITCNKLSKGSPGHLAGWQVVLKGCWLHRPRPFPSPTNSCPSNPLARSTAVLASRSQGCNLCTRHENHNLYPSGYDIIRKLTISF